MLEVATDFLNLVSDATPDNTFVVVPAFDFLGAGVRRRGCIASEPPVGANRYYHTWNATPPTAESSIHLSAATCGGREHIEQRESLATVALYWSCWAVEYTIGRLPRGERT